MLLVIPSLNYDKHVSKRGHGDVMHTKAAV